MRFALVAFSLAVAAAGFAADVLFPQPLHLTRTIEDSISQQTTTVHEYCAGDRVVTVSGDRVVVADYAKQELLEIDRAAGTYSITSFSDLANASAALAPRRESAKARNTNDAKPRKTQAAGRKPSTAGRSMEAWELSVERGAEERVDMQVGIDRGVSLSREALEVLIGASFPNTRRDEHDALLTVAAAAPAAARVTTNAQPQFGLPIEQVTTYAVAGERVTMRSSVVDVRSELPPPALLTIPTGATRVESRAVRLARELRELDQLPSSSLPQ